MKILHINSYFNGSKFYKNLYDKQIEKGLDIDVFVPISKPVPEEFKFDETYTFWSKNHNQYDRFIFTLKQFKIYKDILAKYELNQYDIVHAHSLFTNGATALKIKEKFDIPYIVAVRNTDVNLFFKRMIHLRRKGVKILKNASKIIFLSEAYKNTVISKYVPNNLKEHILKKVKVIPNGIDDYWFDNIYIRSSKVNDNLLKLLYVGVINQNKNIVTTMKALSQLNNKGYKAKLTVVGKIKDKNIYNQIKANKHIRYIEPVTKTDLINIYREHDIFVMPSIHETFGLVYAEAMSQGLPVVYSKGQGFDNQFVDGEVGRSVEALNSNSITEAIIHIDREYKSISSKCIAKVEKFKWCKITDTYTKLYDTR